MPLWAQALRGDLSGFVRDSSGAVMPGVSVRIVNESTTATRVVQTDVQGQYVARGFFAGSYRVEAEKPGFVTAAVAGVDVRPAAVVPVDLVLRIAPMGESIRVTAESAPVIQSESPTQTYAPDSVVFGKYELQNSGNFMVPFTAVQWTSGHASGANAGLVFRGGPANYTALTLEGVGGKGQRFRIPSKAQSSAEVVSFNSPAEYSRSVTANANFRSGTNDVHADYEVNARNPVLNAIHTPFFRGARPAGVFTWRHNLTAGGPVLLPKLYDGRNRTFWFLALQVNPASNELRPNVLNAPTPKMQEGDFSGFNRVVRDPTTGQPFPGNIIPTGRLSPVSLAAAKDFFGKFAYAGGPDNTVGNAVAYLPYRTAVKTTLIKMDHNFRNGDVLTGFLNWSPLKRKAETPEAWMDDARWWSATIGHTRIVRPTILNEFRLGWTRNVDARGKATDDGKYDPLYGADVLKKYGLLGVTAPDATFMGQPQMNFGGVWPTFRSFAQTKTVSSFWSMYDNVSMQRGRHEIKAGFSGRKILDDSAASGNVFGNFVFNGSFSGEPYADFLLGAPRTIDRTHLRPWIAARRLEVGGFVQDQWRIRPTLTLSLGIRWQTYTAPYDKNGLYYNFDLNTLSIVVPNQHALANVSPAWPRNSVPVRLASDVGYPSKLLKVRPDWTPRFGLSWRPAGDWVVRAGYGHYTGTLAFGELQTAGPFQITETFNNAVENGRLLYSFPNPFPPPTAVSPIGVSNATGYDLNFRTGYVQNWNISVEKALSREWGLRASYVGHKLSREPFSYNANTPLPSTQPFTAQRRPYPAFNQLIYGANGGNDSYHGLEFTVTHPFRRGFYVQAGYSWNWNYRDIHDAARLEGPLAANARVDYAWDRSRDRGNSQFWPRHDFVTNFVYEVPYRGDGNKLLGALFSRWAFSGYLNRHSGNYFTPTYTGADPAGINQFTGRPDVVPGCDPYAGGRNAGAGAQWFNPKCFAIPAAGTLGNAKVNSLVGPGLFTMGVNPYKEFPIGERATLRIGAQVDNLTNHPTYAVPAAVINAANAGTIVDLAQTRRTLEGSDFVRNVLLVASIRF